MIFLIILVSFLIGFSHEFTLLKEGNEYSLSIADENKVIAVKKENLRKVVCFDKNGNQKPVEIFQSDKKLKFRGDCTLFGLIYEVKDHVTFIKYLSEEYKGLPESVGFPLEIISSVNPVEVPAGRKITFKVFYKGKPVVGLPVGVNYEFIGKTRRGGEIRVKVRKGLNIITTYIREGERYYETSLLFKGK